MVTRTVVLAAMLAGASHAAAAGQGVLVAPQAVILSHGTTTGSFTVVNPGNQRVEIDLSTLYGIPATDSAGHLFLMTPGTVPDSEPSAADWIEMFPARFVLAPGARRTVRLMVSPPAGTTPHEYWARLVVASRVVPTSPGPTNPDAVNIAIRLEVRSVFPFLYRHGAVATSLRMGQPTAAVTGDSLSVRVPLHREGNAAWIGTLQVSLMNASGAVVREAALPLGVYYDLEPRLTVGTAGLAPDVYRVTVEAVGRRTDLPRAAVLPTAMVTRSLEVLVP